MVSGWVQRSGRVAFSTEIAPDLPLFRRAALAAQIVEALRVLSAKAKSIGGGDGLELLLNINFARRTAEEARARLLHEAVSK